MTMYDERSIQYFAALQLELARNLYACGNKWSKVRRVKHQQASAAIGAARAAANLCRDRDLFDFATACLDGLLHGWEYTNRRLNR
jgi:predicted ATPase with chaperone activity